MQFLSYESGSIAMQKSLFRQPDNQEILTKECEAEQSLSDEGIINMQQLAGGMQRGTKLSANESLSQT